MKNITAILVVMISTAAFGQQLAMTKHVKGETFAEFLQREPMGQQDFDGCVARTKPAKMAKYIAKHKGEFKPSDTWRNYPEALVPVGTPGDQCERMVAASQGEYVEIVRPTPTYELTFMGGHLVSFGGRREENHGHYCIDAGKVYGFDGQGLFVFCQ